MITKFLQTVNTYAIYRIDKRNIQLPVFGLLAALKLVSVNEEALLLHFN
jgi:hypothetical protein